MTMPQQLHDRPRKWGHDRGHTYSSPCCAQFPWQMAFWTTCPDAIRLHEAPSPSSCCRLAVRFWSPLSSKFTEARQVRPKRREGCRTTQTAQTTVLLSLQRSLQRIKVGIPRGKKGQLHLKRKPRGPLMPSSDVEAGETFDL